MKVRRVAALIIVSMLVAMTATFTEDMEKPLDNAEVIKLTKSKIGSAVIVAKIREAKSAKFATSSDDMVKLKDAGVSDDVITAMIEWKPGGATAAPMAQAGTVGGTPSVTLQAKEGAISLKPIDGDVKQIVAPFVGFRRFVVFSDLTAATRIKDRRPTFLISSSRDPRKVWWLVKLDQDKDEDDMDRSIDVESPGYWGGVLSSAPDEDFQIQYDAAEEKPGLWKITPRKDLKPGEYGMYIGKGEMTATLFDFGVDK